jgi:hypothetical protein
MDEKKLTRNDVDFPSNSETKRRPKTEYAQEVKKEKQVAVVKGKAIKQKKSLGKKFSEAFLGEDSKSVGDYIFHDVIIPAIKSTLSDAVSGGIEMLLFGERRSGSRNYSRNGSKTYTSYSSYYGGRDRDRDRRDDRGGNFSRGSRARHDFDDILFESRGEAEDVLSHLVDLTIDYGVASVADFYDLSGIESQFTDNKYGWTNLRDACTDRVRNGYIIRLPQAKPLD